MRVFEGVDDVREYLGEQVEVHDRRAENAMFRKQEAPAGSADFRHWVFVETGAKAEARAYRDAVAALNEIRPGLIGAFERGEITLRPVGELVSDGG